MTLTDLLTAVSQDCGYDAIPSAVVTARLTRYISEGFRHLMSMPELKSLRNTSLSFTSVPGRTVYGIPQSFVQLNQITDAVNAIRLRLMTLDEMRTIDPQENSSGTPTHYVRVGYHPVQFDPDQTTLYVKSDSALDTTQVITIQAVRNFDDVDASTLTFSATLNGTTPVAISPAIQAVQTVSINPVATATVKLYDVPVPDETHRMLAINPGIRSVQYLGIRLWPTPAGAYVYTVDGDLSIIDLSTVNDIPVIPEDFQLILADYGRMKEFGYRSDDSRYAMAQAEYQSKLKFLRERLMNPPDYKPRVGRMSDRGNNLDSGGVWYPSGRW